jgi:archaellum component FlaC
MEFCKKCGSLKINGSCTNKKCDQHIKSLVELATAKQIEYIKELAEQLGEDISDINFDAMSKTDAIDLIDDYLERLDDTEKKLVPSVDILEDSDSDDDDEEEL